MFLRAAHATYSRPLAGPRPRPRSLGPAEHLGMFARYMCCLASDLGRRVPGDDFTCYTGYVSKASGSVAVGVLPAACRDPNVTRVASNTKSSVAACPATGCAGQPVSARPPLELKPVRYGPESQVEEVASKVVRGLGRLGILRSLPNKIATHAEHAACEDWPSSPPRHFRWRASSASSSAENWALRCDLGLIGARSGLPNSNDTLSA